jgi:two-component system cell cycle response regulator DivK
MARERILIAEDNEKNLKLFRDVLQVNGFETLEATTGEDAIELATQNDPILILMDIRLAGIDGVAALHRLREEERTASIPVIALTAQAMAGDRERLLETGFDDYISKPVNVREFLAVVQRFCERQGNG